MGFPGLGPEPVLDAMRVHGDRHAEGHKLTIWIVTDVSWFDPQRDPADVPRDDSRRRSATCSARGRSSSSLDLMRRSRTLAFTGWQKEQRRRAAASSTAATRLRRGARTARSPAHRPADARPLRRAASRWNRLTPLDDALAVARAHGWRVVGLSGPTPRWETYERELKALFAKHGYRWRIRRMPA